MAEKTGKKLINTVDRCVDENLDGFVRVNPGIVLLEGHRVVVRADITSVISAGKVTLVSGGGSGHEPAHAGYVGEGMLSAAVAGSVFTSPPPGDILAAIRVVGCNNPAGTLLIIKNYTGDRLNFGLAAERAKGEGLKVAMVIVDEDCALASADRTAGRRGLCGTVLIHKLAGALAEEGKSLEDIQTYLTAAVRKMGTIGLSLTCCSVPGSGPSFTLGADQMELGLGIHGEAGVQRMKLTTAKEAVRAMIDHMTLPDAVTSLKLKPGDNVACMVNNLGGTSVLEMNILAGEACKYLENKGLVVSRLYNGSFMTSLEMAGFSITILILDDTSTRCLDAATKAPGWTKPYLPSGASVRQNPPAMAYLHTQKSQEKSEGFAKVSKEVSSTIYRAVKGACDRLVGAEEELNALDTQSGDGDCGTTHRRGAQAILEGLGSVENPGFPLDSPAALALSLANCVEERMGGSSGALYSLFLTAASQPLQKATGVGAFSAALKEGNSAMARYGGACPGDRTMLDALTAASEKLITLENSGLSPAEIFKQVAKAAEEGARSTVGMRAQAGRASYVSPDFLTKPDPGAMGVALWMKGASDALAL